MVFSYRWLVGLVIVGLLAACGEATPAQSPTISETSAVVTIPTETQAQASTPTETQAQASTGTQYPLTIENFGRVLTIEAPPQRAVSLNLHTTEIMLALGLETVMVGTAFNNNVILPEYQAAYEQIPVLADRYPSLEVLLAANPDFVYGRTSAFGETGVAGVEELERLGITAYAVQGTVVQAATMEDTYADILNLGRIFDIEERANALVAEMQQRIEAVQTTIASIEKPVSVLVYDAGDTDLFTAGQSLQTYLIELAGGRNVFDDVEQNWITVSWEEAVERQPEVIVINDYGETTAQAKIDTLLSNPALANIPAIQNQRFVILPLPSVFEGVRNPAAVELLAQGFHPELFGAVELNKLAERALTMTPLAIKATFSAQ